jgi:hypothetical protein
MPARISVIADVAEAEKYLGDGARLAGTPPSRLMATLTTLTEHLPPTSTLHVALDGYGEYFAVVEDGAHHYPHGEVFALREDGSIGHGDVNQPIYFGEVGEFLLSSEMSIKVVSQITESALDAFWERVATLLPGIPGDMAPGQTHPLERIALQTLALWVTNNHPQFAGDEGHVAGAGLRATAEDPHAN